MPLSMLPSILGTSGASDDPAGSGQPLDDRERDPLDNDRLADFKRWFFAARDGSAKWREEAEDDFGFDAGHQWAEDDIQVLRDANRPVIVFNRVGRVLDSVSGMEVGNRQELHYLPREIGDVGVNELATAAADWIRDQCDAEDEESESFRDLITCGMAWTDTRMDYETESTGKVISGERIDPLEMFWDPAARKRNLADSRYRMRVRDIPIDDARAMWPDADDEDLHASWADWTRGSGEAHDREAARNYRSGLFGDTMPSPREDRSVRVVQVQWTEKEAYALVADPDSGQMVEFPVDKFQALQAAGVGVQGQVLRRKVHMQAFVGNDVLEEGPLCAGESGKPCPDFTLQVMTGKRDRNRNSWYGLVRGMKDPQRWANKWLSQILHIINSNAKGGLLMEKTAVDDPQAFENSWSDPAAISYVADGALSRNQVQPKPAPTLPAGIFQLMQFAISSITDVPGINLELLGLADREQAGVLEHQRKQAGMTILASLFDSLRNYRKRQGRILLHFIREYVPEGTLIRLSEEGQHQYVPLLKDQMAGEFDVIVDQAPSSPNNKELVWGLMTQLMPFLTKMPVPGEVWAQIIRYSPLPESVGQKIIEAMQPKQDQGPSPEEMAQQLEQAKVQQAGQLEQAKMAHAQQGQQIDAQLQAAKLADGKEARAQQAALEERKLQHEKEMRAIDILMAQQQAAREQHGKVQDMVFKQQEAEAGRSAQAQEKQQDRVQQFVLDSKSGGIKDVAETQKASEKVLADVGAVAEKVITRLDEQLQTIEATTERIEERDAQILAELRDRPRRIELRRDQSGLVTGWQGDNGSGGQVLRDASGAIKGATIGNP